MDNLHQPLPVIQISPKNRPTTLMDLNDVCLLHLLAFLDPLSELQASVAYPRIRQWITERTKRHFKNHKLNPEAVRSLPPQQFESTYQVMGQLTQTLSVIHIAEEDMLQALPHFTALEGLHLSMNHLRNVAAIDSFPSLSGAAEIRLDLGVTDKAYLNALLRKFATTAQHLDCLTTPRADFAIIPRLETLTIEGVWLGRKSGFWRHNTTLRVLKIIAHQADDSLHDFDIVRENLKAIAAIPTLKGLLFNVKPTILNLRPNIFAPFLYPVRVEVTIPQPDVVLAFLGALGPQVTHLTVTTTCKDLEQRWDMAQLVGERLPNVTEMTYFDGFQGTLIDFSPILDGCKSLTELVAGIDSPGSYLPIFQALPRLEKLFDLSVTKCTLHYPKELVDFAEREKRTITIRGRDSFEL